MGKAAAAGAAWRVYRNASKPGSPGVFERLRALPRMINGALRGDYVGMSKMKLSVMALGVVYLVWPLDFIPEFIPFLGVMDDLGVLLWLVGMALSETDRFIDWERRTFPGQVIG